MSYQRNASDEKLCAFINLFCTILLTKRDERKYELRRMNYDYNRVRIRCVNGDILISQFELNAF